jgi:3',5'-cyclic AMP phosphodiesterase CpdA
MMMDEQNLVLLHLSDIHFRTRRKNYDLDQFLRNELERDVKSLLAEVHHVHGIIVTGDVAYSGMPAEYAIARAWIQKLTVLLGSPSEMVWTIPGNHDINQAFIKASPTLQTIHNDLRHVPMNALDSKLHGYLNDAVMETVLLQPLAAYNSFASAYGCTSTVDALMWQYKLPLNDGSFLRLNGLNSAVLSDHLDNDTTVSPRYFRAASGWVRFAVPAGMLLGSLPSALDPPGAACDLMSLSPLALLSLLPGPPSLWEPLSDGRPGSSSRSGAHPRSGDTPGRRWPS